MLYLSWKSIKPMSWEFYEWNILTNWNVHKKLKPLPYELFNFSNRSLCTYMTNTEYWLVDELKWGDWVKICLELLFNDRFSGEESTWFFRNFDNFQRLQTTYHYSPCKHTRSRKLTIRYFIRAEITLADARRLRLKRDRILSLINPMQVR